MFRFLSLKEFLPYAYSLLTEAKIDTSIQNDCVNGLNNYSPSEKHAPKSEMGL